MNINYSNRISLHYLIALLIFTSGYVFYLLARGFDPLFGIQLGLNTGTSLPSIIFSSYATFTHVLALALFSYAIVGLKQNFKLILILFWSFLNTAVEIGQSQSISDYFSFSKLPGTFDIVDLFAVLAAVLIFYIITGMLENKLESLKPKCKVASNRNYAFALPLVALFGVMSIIASDEGADYPRDEPVYMSYKELRGPLVVETNRELRKSGKIYLYQNLILVSEPNKGIHIYDNSKPESPLHKAFINLPGNLDIAVRAGYLYADSFIDLVVIDINDLNNIVLSERIEEVFPYNAYQAIGRSNIRLYGLDKSKGVIIDVIRKPAYRID